MEENAGVFEPFNLTCLDHNAGPVFMNFFMCFRVTKIEESLLFIEKGVTRLVNRLPFLAGDVIRTSTTDGRVNVLQIQPSSTLIHEVPMLRTEHHPEHVLPNTPEQAKLGADLDQRFAALDGSYIPPVPLLSLAPGPRPVLRFQINVLKDGIILAMGFHHSVVDATGAGLLIEMLADCCRDGDSSISVSGIQLEKEIQIKRAVDEIGIVARANQQDTAPEPNSHTSEPAVQPPMGESTWIPPKLSVYSFSLSSASLAHLKTACNKVLPVVLESEKNSPETAEKEVDEKSPQEFISTNDVLTALLAISIYQARSRATQTDLDPSRAKLAMAVNLREKGSCIPKTYLGNSLTIAAASVQPLTVENVIDGVTEKQHHPDIGNTFLLETARVALQLRRSLAKIDDVDFRQFVSRLWSNLDWSTNGADLPTTMVSSWRHLKVYRLDFGAVLGRVVEFQAQALLMDGICTIQPERVAQSHDSALTGPEAGWEVDITLESDAMECFVQEGLFTGLSQGAIRRV